MTERDHTAPNGRVGRPRNVGHERSLTAMAASMNGSSSAGLQTLAETRALPGPLRDFPLRDFVHEGMEEAADWRNYLCWSILAIDLSGLHSPTIRAARLELVQALAGVITAFEHTGTARALLGPTGLLAGRP